MHIARYILGWSEVWILFLPLAILQFRKKQPGYMKPIIIYLWLAFFFNLFCDGLALVLDYLPKAYQSNTIVYNIHSVTRLICFSVFFINLNQPYYRKIQKILIAVFCLFFVFYFGYLESFFNTRHISGDLFTAESFLLLFFCMLFYLNILRNENDDTFINKAFWVATGICIFGVINFFVFLFYVPLLDEKSSVASDIWYLHNIAFIIFILFISKALYDSPSN